MPFCARTLPVNRLRPTLAWVALALLPIAAGCGRADLQESGMSASEVQAVSDSIRLVIDGVNESASAKDPGAFMALWAQTDSVVYVRSGTAFFGWEAVAENHRDAFSTPGIWGFAAAETHVRVLSPGSGVATAFIETSSTSESGDSRQGWFAFSAVVERRPEGWKIIYAHGSYPEPGSSPWGPGGPPGS